MSFSATGCPWAKEIKLPTRIRSYTEEQDNFDYINFAVLQGVLLVEQPLVQFSFFLIITVRRRTTNTRCLHYLIAFGSSMHEAENQTKTFSARQC